MGGYGSGHRITRKSTVEECRAVDIAVLPVSDFASQSIWPRVITWRNYKDEVTASIGYRCEPQSSGSAILRFSYSVTRNGNEIKIEEPIRVVTTHPYFGGVRWWFICPLASDGKGCQRRVRKIYLSPGNRYFGCRACYNLTYESVRSHDNRVGRLLRTPHAVLAALESKNFSTKFLGMKAFCKLRGFL
jgi:hypothetical protein